MATNQEQVEQALLELANAKRNRSGAVNGNAALAIVRKHKASHCFVGFEDTEFSKQISDEYVRITTR